MKKYLTVYASCLFALALTGTWLGIQLADAGPSNVHNGGSFSSLILGVRTVTANYSVAPNDYFIRVNSGGAHTITLPAAKATGRVIVIKQTSSGAVTVNPAGSDTIDGGASASLIQANTSLTFVDGLLGRWDKQ